MKVSKISIKNILGLESIEIQPGSVTEITGSNGSGKTSTLDAIRAALGAGHDATLLRKGATEGQVVLVLDDGTEIRRRITEDKSDTTVVHPHFGKLPQPRAYIKKLADALSLNPVAFLTADRKARVDQLLQAIPMKITADRLGFVPNHALEGVDLDRHALEVIGAIGKAIYDLRTGINRAEKEKRATAKQMADSLPADSPEGDWKASLDGAMAESTELQQSTRSLLAAIDKEASSLIEAARAECEAHCEAVKAERDAAIERIRADAEIEIQRTHEGYEEVRAQAESRRQEQRKAAEADFRPKEAEIKERIGHARAMAEAHSKARDAREFIQSLTRDADKLEAESSKLTHAMGQLEILKSELLGQLPIEGLSVQDGDIYVGGIPFDRVNESKRIRLAIEIAKLRAGSLGLVAVDGLERLDPRTFEAFKREAAKSKLQFVISRVSDGPLQIESEVA